MNKHRSAYDRDPHSDVGPRGSGPPSGNLKAAELEGWLPMHEKYA